MLRVGFQPPPPSSSGTDTGRTLALPMVQDLVGLDLQGFYKVSPAVKLGLAFLFFFPQCSWKQYILVFSFFFKKHIALSSHALLYNCVLQLGQVTVLIFVAPATLK